MDPGREGQSSWVKAQLYLTVLTISALPDRLALQLVDETHDSYVNLLQDM